MPFEVRRGVGVINWCQTFSGERKNDSMLALHSLILVLKKVIAMTAGPRADPIYKFAKIIDVYLK